MRLINGQKLTELQKNPSKIRNICIMAHVDHGKTTLADSLVACNGIISSKMVGKLRYMDSRKDEQERGITMKSSSIALYYNTGGKEFLVNLIDSPGHVDFSSEVSTAIRLCDGAIIVVDVLEGVCPQTRVALKQAWMENIRPVLVLNKIDRLILEMKLTPLDAYIHLTQVLEQVNAVMGSLFTTEVLGRTGDMPDAKETMTSTGEQLYNWSDGLENADDSQLYFSPDHGNVAFASAVDGWGFCITDFAKVYSIKLGLSQEELQRCLWGDFYLNAKTKKIIKGAQEKARKPLFVQLVLENIWSLYDIIVVRKDKEKVLKIVESLNIKVTSRDLRHTDTKVQLHAVCSQWLPLATTVLDMVCLKLPAPNDLSEEKVERLMCSQTQSLDTMPSESQALKQAFLECSSQETAPVIVFISKMFPIERKSLPQNKPKVLTPEEMAERRAQARLRQAAQIAGLGDFKSITEEHTSIPEPVETIIESEDVFIAFARVFSGCLKKGQEVYVLGPKHNPAQALDMVKRGRTIDSNLTLKDLKSDEHITKVTISELYIMMGRELEILEEVPAGNVLGIGGLEEHVLKTATLSTQLACPAFSELQLMAVPILRVAVEPTKHSDLPALVRGLKLLNQADACVQVIIQETGELVLVTAGEVHLERCLDDLRQRYAKVGVNASEPIVPFKETIVPPPIVDMVNEAIQEQNTSTKKDNDDPSINSGGLVTTITPNKQSTVKIRATPLPSEVTAILDNNSELIRVLDSFMNNKNNESMLSEDMELLNLKETNQVMADKTLKALELLRKDLSEAFKKAGGEWSESSTNEIWSFGPRRCGPNVFINRVPGHSGRCVWQRHVKEKCKESLLEYDSSFINGFQMVTLAGPLCEEPMMGVAFIVEDWTIEPSENLQSSAPYGPLSGQIMSAVKESCRKAFQAQPQRLMAAMYSCSVQTNAEVLGKMYAVLNRRHGRILSSDMTQGSETFNVIASMPVVESFSFAPEMRKHTSGLANPQLVFSHWEVIDVDPYWSPRTEEEYLHFGDKADSDNLARRYMDSVRRRKGLAVEDKLVQFAEKQRTLGRNK